MLNKVHVPAGTLNEPESFWGAANAAQKDATISQSERLSALFKEPQHRNFITRPDGLIAKQTIYVCTGENYFNRDDIPKDSTFTFVWPGEPQEEPSGNRNWRVTYEYSDDRSSLGRRWLAFLLDTERCPWRYVLRHAMSLDPEECYKNKNVTFQHLDQLPFEIHQMWMMAGRWMLENPEGLELWGKLVDVGVHPATAFVLGVHYGTPYGESNYQRRYPLDHEPIYYTNAIGEYLIRGEYFCNPNPVVGNAPFLVRGQRAPNNGLSSGYHPVGWYAPNPQRKWDCIIDPTPIGSAFTEFHTKNSYVTFPQLLILADLLEGKTKDTPVTTTQVLPPKAEFSTQLDYEDNDASERYNEDYDDDPEW